MGIRENLDLSAYLVIGPENTCGRSVGDVVGQALRAGFTCVQVRSKGSSAVDLLECVREAADAIAAAGRQDTVALLVDDRLDVALAARDAGIKVDGVHVGQDDVPPDVCRRYLGENAIVGLTARKRDMLEYVCQVDADCVDYLGIGPLRRTASKQDLAVDESGKLITQSFEDLRRLAAASPVPIVVGGGVSAADVPMVRAAGANGFFVISAVCAAPDPYAAAKELVDAWRGDGA